MYKYSYYITLYYITLHFNITLRYTRINTNRFTWPIYFRRILKVTRPAGSDFKYFQASKCDISMKLVPLTLSIISPSWRQLSAEYKTNNNEVKYAADQSKHHVLDITLTCPGRHVKGMAALRDGKAVYYLVDFRGVGWQSYKIKAPPLTSESAWKTASGLQ